MPSYRANLIGIIDIMKLENHLGTSVSEITLDLRKCFRMRFSMTACTLPKVSKRDSKNPYRISEQPSKPRLYEEKLKSTKGVARNVPELREGTTTMSIIQRAVPDFF